MDTTAGELRIIVPQVMGRYVFYNASYWDGNDPAAGAQDDAAIAADKQALLPGQTATFANYTSYFRGVNGIMIDVSDLPPGTPTAADFEFRAGNGGDPASWALTAAPATIAVRRGAGVGGSDRVTLIWSDASAVRNQWLRVTALPGGGMALGAADVFCFGNTVGEVGNSPADTMVNTLDVSLTRANQTTYVNPPSITNPYDFTRDHMVNTLDISLVRSSQTTYSIMLKIITISAGGSLPLPVALPPLGRERDVMPSAPAAPLGSGIDALAADTTTTEDSSTSAALPVTAAAVPVASAPAVPTMDALAVPAAAPAEPAPGPNALPRSRACPSMRMMDILASRLPDAPALWDLRAFAALPRRAR